MKPNIFESHLMFAEMEFSCSPGVSLSAQSELSQHNFIDATRHISTGSFSSPVKCTSIMYLESDTAGENRTSL
jgi:hypothetical protein